MSSFAPSGPPGPGGGDKEPEAGPSKGKGPLSCAECRRLKLRCDRQVPCSNCTRRKCVDLCPNQTRPGRRAAKSEFAGQDASEILGAIGDLLNQHGLAVSRRGEGGAISIIPTSGGSTRDIIRDTSHPIGDDRPSQRLGRNRSSRSRSPQRSQMPIQTNDQISFSPINVVPSQPTPVRFDYDIPLTNRSPFRSSPQSQSAAVKINSPHEESHGTLVLGKSGRSRYLGPTAGPEWLRDQEVNLDKTPAVSRPGSPRKDHFGSAFPFHQDGHITADMIITALPAEDNGRALVDSYFRYFAWNHNPAPRPTVQSIFDEVYRLQRYREVTASDTTRRVGYQRLALLFIIFALGSLHSLELSPQDPSADEYLALGQTCLVKGDFMKNNTIAGVQALNLMGHYYLDAEAGRDGESAWPLWGLVMRIIQAMGLHRDGAKWDLSQEVVEERRHVFWECYTIEVFQSNCHSRPSSFQRRHIDTQPPYIHDVPGPEPCFYSIKFQLARISHEILDQAMDVEPPAYNEIQRLYAILCDFEGKIPYGLRCRTAMLSTTSVYPDPEMAIRAGPEVDKRNLRLTFEQFTLALNLAENFLFLQRPYFVRAIHENTSDPILSPFGDAYLAVVERSSVIVQVVRTIYDLYPEITARHWFYWYHLFTAAVCLGTIPIKNPLNPLSQYALIQLDQATSIYASVKQRMPTEGIAKNHEWLCRLLARAQTQIQAGYGRNVDTVIEESGEEGSLLGWRTRLIQHAGNGTIKTSPAAMPSFAMQARQMELPLNDEANEIEGMGHEEEEGEQETSAGDLLQKLWDDMLQPGSRTEAADLANFTSWSWDAGFEGLLHGEDMI